MKRAKTRIALLLLASYSACTASASTAWAQDATDMQAFRRNCMMDYFEFCGGLSPDGPEVRACFSQNRAKLSSGCAKAISLYEKRRAAGDRDDASD